MTDCSLKLKSEGKAYPRTCPKCFPNKCVDGFDVKIVGGSGKVFVVWTYGSAPLAVFDDKAKAALFIMENGHWRESGPEIAEVDYNPLPPPPKP